MWPCLGRFGLWDFRSSSKAQSFSLSFCCLLIIRKSGYLKRKTLHWDHSRECSALIHISVAVRNHSEQKQPGGGKGFPYTSRSRFITEEIRAATNTEASGGTLITGSPLLSCAQLVFLYILGPMGILGSLEKGWYHLRLHHQLAADLGSAIPMVLVLQEWEIYKMT